MCEIERERFYLKSDGVVNIIMVLTTKIHFV